MLSAVSHPAQPRRLLHPALAFVLGAACTLTAALVLLRPDVLARWRWGAIPSGGLVMTLRPAPPELRGPGPGPWVLVELRNVSRTPQRLAYLDPPGEELGFVVHDAQGQRLVPERDPAAPSLARPLQTAQLPPGEGLAWPVDLSTRVTLAGPGPYTVEASRFPLGEDPRGGGRRCRSNAVVVPAPASGR